MDFQGDFQGKRERPALKVCGLTREDDVLVCLGAGVAFVGFNFVAGSLRAVSPAAAAALWGEAVARHGGAASTRPVAVVADLTPAALADVLDAFPAAVALQLHGREDLAALGRVREMAGGRRLWKATGVRSAADVRAAGAFGSAADLVLLDAAARAPGAPVEGGSGQRFDWSWLAAWPGTAPLGVAGGVRAGTLADLARHARPALVDVCSGVESAPGKKDASLVRALKRELETVW
jgi:phosphoribosylanthranilate isomerase